MRILYVEDNPANISLLHRIARMGGHTVINYNEGEEALENFERDNPDLILMDLQLAGALGGLDVVRKLRSDGVKTPIIAVTAYAMMGDKERCLEAGCDGYMPKPLVVAELVELVQQYQIQMEQQPSSAEPKAEQKTNEASAVQEKSAEPPAETAPAAEASKEKPAQPKSEPAASPVPTAASTQPAPAEAKADSREGVEGKPAPAQAAKPAKEREQPAAAEKPAAVEAETKPITEGKAPPPATSAPEPDPATSSSGSPSAPQTRLGNEATQPDKKALLEEAALIGRAELFKKD